METVNKEEIDTYFAKKTEELGEKIYKKVFDKLNTSDLNIKEFQLISKTFIKVQTYFEDLELKIKKHQHHNIKVSVKQDIIIKDMCEKINNIQPRVFHNEEECEKIINIIEEQGGKTRSGLNKLSKKDSMLLTRINKCEQRISNEIKSLDESLKMHIIEREREVRADVISQLKAYNCKLQNCIDTIQKLKKDNSKSIVECVDIAVDNVMKNYVYQPIQYPYQGQFIPLNFT